MECLADGCKLCWSSLFSRMYTCYLSSSNSNIFVSLVKEDGNVLLNISAGMMKFTGPRRKTVYAAQMVGKELGLRILKLGVNSIAIVIRETLYSKRVKGALRSLIMTGVTVSSIEFKYVRTHNGVRPRKMKRK